MKEYNRREFLGLVGLALAGCGKYRELEKRVEKSSGIVSVEGAELHYVMEGKGTPCIVLGHSESCRRVFSQELRDHFKFVFTDLRNDARSNSSLESSKITLDTFLDDIDKVRRTLGLDKTAVLGHSIYSLLALEYARKYPQNTSHVIMTGFTPYRSAVGVPGEFWESDASDERKMIFKQNLEKLKEVDLNKMSPKERMVNTYVTITPKIWYDPTYDLSWIYELVDVDSYEGPSLFTIFRNYDIAKRPGQITSPVFLGLGRYDYLCPYFLWDDRKDVLPNLSYNLFEKSGHFPMVEEQELFDKKLIEWINGLK